MVGSERVLAPFDAWLVAEKHREIENEFRAACARLQMAIATVERNVTQYPESDELSRLPRLIRALSVLRGELVIEEVDVTDPVRPRVPGDIDESERAEERIVEPVTRPRK